MVSPDLRQGDRNVSWWTGDGHITLPKAVIRLLAEAAMSLREQIVQEIFDECPDLHPEVGVAGSAHHTPEPLPARHNGCPCVWLVSGDACP